MKKSYIRATCLALVAGFLLVACQDNSKKEAIAKEQVDAAKENLDEAKEDLTNARNAATQQEWDDFKANTNATIAQNETRIAELKADLKKTGKSMDETYQKKLEDLETKNQEMKIKLTSYKNDASSDWNSFKEESKHDLDELGKAFKNFTINNK